MLSKQSNKEKYHAHGVSGRFRPGEVPQHKMPDKGIMPVVAYQMITDFLDLDGMNNQNMASFLTTYCDEEANKLILKCIPRNFADHNAYPHMLELHEHCIDMLADLFHDPDRARAVGVATVGSSEAFELAALSLKFRWREKMRRLGKPTDRPNIIFGCNAQVALEKFARYFDVEARMIPVTEDSHFAADFRHVRELVDENTIGVVAILGSTYSGQFEDASLLNDELERLHSEQPQLDVPIHIDAASGGFVAPFAYPQLRWDFRLSRVVSINVSGHKYGLTYPGLGWVIFRDESMLAKDLVFTVDYIGGPQPTYTLNFSRPSAMMVTQYYNFIRLGREGYRNIISSCLENARLLSDLLQRSGLFVLRSELDDPHGALPLVAFSLSPTAWDNNDLIRFDEFDLQHAVKRKGWLVPAYNLPKSCEHINICRVVVREEHTANIIEALANDLISSAHSLRAERVKICKQALECVGHHGAIPPSEKKHQPTEDDMKRAKKTQSLFKGVC